MKQQSFVPHYKTGTGSRKESKFKKILQGIVQTWLQISSPDERRFSPSIEDQERLRRSRLLSALFPFVFVVTVLVAPTAIPVPVYWIPLACFVVLSLTALAFNRMTLITLSGLFYIFAIDAALVILMITLPNGIRNSNIPDFDFFILSTLIGGVVLPRRVIPFLCIMHILIIIMLFSLLPHDPLLVEEIRINQRGFAYSELSDALIIQIVGAAIAWLAAWSVDRALLRASRAEELAEARKRLNEQAEQIVKQKERLEYGIGVLKEAQARFANGDYSARAQLQSNELSPLAGGFNLMVERLNRVAQVAQEYRRVESALFQLIEAQNALVDRRALRPLAPSGTIVDHIYPMFQRYYRLNQFVSNCSGSLNRVYRDLARQKNLIAQLDTVLFQVYALSQLLPEDAQVSRSSFIQLIEKAQQLCEHFNARGKECLQETRQLEQLLRGVAQLS